jgi:hypothetical protein
MKQIALTLALAVAGSSLASGLASNDANAGARKICKQALMTHPIPGTHHEQMKRCKAEYKAYKKAGGARDVGLAGGRTYSAPNRWRTLKAGTERLVLHL